MVTLRKVVAWAYIRQWTKSEFPHVVINPSELTRKARDDFQRQNELEEKRNSSEYSSFVRPSVTSQFYRATIQEDRRPSMMSQPSLYEVTSQIVEKRLHDTSRTTQIREEMIIEQPGRKSLCVPNNYGID